MRRRTFEEMITYFNQTVSDMDIARKYKMTLLGIVTALLQKHDEDVAQIVLCKDCKWFTVGQKGKPWNISKRYCNRSVTIGMNENDYCSRAERRTE